MIVLIIVVAQTLYNPTLNSRNLIQEKIPQNELVAIPSQREYHSKDDWNLNIIQEKMLKNELALMKFW